MNRALGLATVAESFHASAVCGYGRKGPGLWSRPSRHSITTTWASDLRACQLRHPGWIGGAGADRGGSVRRRPVRLASPLTWVSPFQRPVCRLWVCNDLLVIPQADARGNAAIRKRLRPRHEPPNGEFAENGRPSELSPRGPAGFRCDVRAKSERSITRLLLHSGAQRPTRLAEFLLRPLARVSGHQQNLPLSL